MTAEGVLKGFLVGALVATAITLVIGLISFSRQTPQGAAYRNKIMHLRILCQGAAIAIFSLLLFMKGH